MIPELRVTLQGAATGRIQWHVIPEPHITLQGAATWWIHCHDSWATCHIEGCSHLAKSMSWSCHIAGCKNSIRHIKNRFLPYFILVFLFLMQFRFWWAAAFVSSPIHLLYSLNNDQLYFIKLTVNVYKLVLIHTMPYKKLNYRRETARCFASLNILISHSWWLRIVPLESLGMVSNLHSIVTMAVSLAVLTQYANVTDAI